MSTRTPFDADVALVTALNSDWAQNGYRSEDDAQQVASLVQDLIEHRKHVALSCRDADTLDHYSRLLVRDLRQRDGVKVVPYFPSSTEVLLARLNELLAQITIEQAMRRNTLSVGDIHVFVLHDTPSLANAELSLLVQLINDLPGTQLRLVLVLDSDDREHARLPLLGKKVRHWDVPTPHPEPGSLPVLTQTVDGSVGTPPPPARVPWWQRLGRLTSRKPVSAVAAMCVLMLGALFSGMPRWSDGESTAIAVLQETVPPSERWTVGRLAEADTRTDALLVPAWLSSRCVAVPGQGASACHSERSPS